LGRFPAAPNPTERQLEIENLLTEHKGDKDKVAELVGITRGSLNSSMQRLEAKRRRLARMVKNGR
jgi:DNA-binding NtrC family response regulator